MRFAWATLSLLLASACDVPANNQSVTAAEVENQPEVTFRAISGNDVLAMIAPEGLQADDFALSAREECGDREFCKVMAWTSESDAARSFPMTDREVQTLAFQYTHNRATGYEQRLWDCSRFPRKTDAECISTAE